MVTVLSITSQDGPSNRTNNFNSVNRFSVCVLLSSFVSLFDPGATPFRLFNTGLKQWTDKQRHVSLDMAPRPDPRAK